MKILVTGSDGMLGQDLVRAAEQSGHEVRSCPRTRLDVTDAVEVEDRISVYRPDAVVNCAAWTDVDAAEEHQDEAMAVNAIGAGNVSAAAARIGAKVIYVSSDCVFDGRKRTPYTESDVPAPISSYGRSKLSGEEATLFANRRSMVVRTAWTFGIGGSNFVETMLHNGASEGRVLVVHDQVGSPTWTWHLAQGILRQLDSDAYGIHHMAGGGHCSYYDFAREIFDRAGIEVATLSTDSAMLGRAAARPVFSALESEYPNAIRLPSWQEGLTGYLKQIKAAAARASG